MFINDKLTQMEKDMLFAAYHLGRALESAPSEKIDLAKEGEEDFIINYSEIVAKGWNNMDESERAEHQDSIGVYTKHKLRRFFLYDFDEHRPLKFEETT